MGVALRPGAAGGVGGRHGRRAAAAGLWMMMRARAWTFATVQAVVYAASEMDAVEVRAMA